MAACLRHVTVPRWEEWASVQAPALVVYAKNGMFTREQQDLFVGHRLGTERIDIANAGHDAHLEQTATWIRALLGFLDSRRNPAKLA